MQRNTPQCIIDSADSCIILLLYTLARERAGSLRQRDPLIRFDDTVSLHAPAVRAGNSEQARAGVR